MPLQPSSDACAATGGVQPDLPFVPPLMRRLRGYPQRGHVADAAYVALACTSWVAGNLLAALGALVALLLVLCGGDLDMFFFQLNNLTRRYVEADLGRRAAFQHDVALAFSIGCLLLFAVRSPLFARRLRRELREEVR